MTVTTDRVFLTLEIDIRDLSNSVILLLQRMAVLEETNTFLLERIAMLETNDQTSDQRIDDLESITNLTSQELEELEEAFNVTNEIVETHGADIEGKISIVIMAKLVNSKYALFYRSVVVCLNNI